MAQGDYYDNEGNYIPAPSPDEQYQPPAPSVPQEGGAATRSPDQKQQIIDGIIIPDFTKLAGRPPDASEIEEYFEVYRRFGGDLFRSKVQERFPASSGAARTGFTWGDSDFGAPPEPFGEQYSAGSYTPPEYREAFNAPTAESLQNDPGYQARLNATSQGLERSAAAKGSILSGGFVGKTMPRQLGEFASNEYANAFGRAFDTYRQKYGEFSDAASRGADAFKTNEAGKLNQFQTRYNSYQDLVRNRRASEQDRWGREMDLSRLGLDSTTAGR